MDQYLSIVTIILGLSIIVYGVYLTITTVTDKIILKQQFDAKRKNTDLTLPLRLQAYERMSLFLERISPSSLLLRLAPVATSALELQQILLNDIREEYNHNVAQQIYISNHTWEQIGLAMNEVIADINKAAAEVSSEAPPTDLGKKIFSIVIAREVQPTTHALKILKDEVREIF
ncbi:MAG TPA: hypothetical protein VGN64_13180 [Dyadobacter sp.]|jgi:hypothetical protein|nr:hypothetical protein [Dyadobacter sp.]